MHELTVVSRFRVEDADEAGFRADAQAALGALAERPGFEEGEGGRNLDDPGLWLLCTRWRDVGSYRRALSSYDVKVTAVPLLSRAIDEPSAYQPVEPGSATNAQIPRALD